MESIKKAQEILQVFYEKDISESVYLELTDRISEGLEEAYRLGVDSKSNKMENKHYLVAQIKDSSKYFGQTEPDTVFPIKLIPPSKKVTKEEPYTVIGGPGEQYRLSDIWIYAQTYDGDLIPVNGKKNEKSQL